MIYFYVGFVLIERVYIQRQVHSELDNKVDFEIDVCSVWVLGWDIEKGQI